MIRRLVGWLTRRRRPSAPRSWTVDGVAWRELTPAELDAWREERRRREKQDTWVPRRPGWLR
jgi:hypothetical protein